MTSRYKDILYDIEDGVARVTINRPQVLNAFTQDTLDEIEDAIDTAEADRRIGVLVLTGAGERAFCAGGDVNWEAKGGLNGVRYELGRQIVNCSKPVIARVNGYAIGGGIISSISATSRLPPSTPSSARTGRGSALPPAAISSAMQRTSSVTSGHARCG